MTKVIFFHNPQIDVRGTCVALYDYAKYNEDLLHNKSIIVSNKIVDFSVFKKFNSRFPVFIYTLTSELENLLNKHKADFLYLITYGNRNEFVNIKIPLLVHCVFDLSKPFGHKYVAISNALSRKYEDKYDVVPHMISLEKGVKDVNLRKRLNIPQDSIVFGRYGGEDTFNLEFCHRVIYNIVNQRQDIYFIFANTPQFCPAHKQIIFTGNLIDNDDKNRFINTCDAHLECGTLGHSFGLAIGEFSVNNKPIICYKHFSLWNTAHIEILGDKGIYFTNEDEFREILTTFNKKEWENRDNNCYREFSPEKVMKIFNKVFLN